MYRPTPRSTALATLGILGLAGALAASFADRAVEPAAPVPSAPGPAAAPESRAAQKTARRAGERRAALAAGLGRELHLDTAAVTAALVKLDVDAANEARARGRAAFKTRLDTAVAAGRLTPQDGAAVMRAVDAGVLTPTDG